MREERQEQRGWHLDKRFSISHILGTLSLAGSIIYWGMQMDGRIAKLEYIASLQTQRDDSQDAQRDKMQAELESQLAAINDKLDRLIERQLPRR